MITLPNGLANFMQGQNLDGLKPFAFLFRNKWDSVNEKYALDTTPIDISTLIVKPNTLSMTLDVNEIAQYNANNVTLTLSDTKNYFVEGTPNSYFPDGYQLYGSRVVLYYGTDSTNRTPLFTGVIKDLPTHKPEQYQVELKLVSPLEMLKDIEAKDFSDKVTGEALTYIETDSDGHRVYNTSGTGVGGFDAVYANSDKLFEGVDYEVDKLSDLNLPAVVKIINSAYYSATITADYYTWKKNLTIEQIVAGLVALAGYNSGSEDIRSVIWNTAVRNPPQSAGVWAAIGYYPNGVNKYKFNWTSTSGLWNNTTGTGGRVHYLPANFDFSFTMHLTTRTLQAAKSAFSIGDSYSGNTISWMAPTFGSLNLGPAGVNNGITFRQVKYNSTGASYLSYFLIYQIVNGSATLLYQAAATNNTNFRANISIVKRGGSVVIFLDNTQILTVNDNTSYQYDYQYGSGGQTWNVENQVWNLYNSSLTLLGANLTTPCIISTPCDKTASGEAWGAINADLGETEASYFLAVFFSNDNANWSSPINTGLNTAIGRMERYLYFILGISSTPTAYFDIEDPTTYYIALTLLVNLVNLTGLTVLEALQDLALISGYEFGVDRQGVFFFKPRVASTTPTYILGHNEIVKVDTVKKNLNDFFTKLTLTFAQVPLEFYANTGDRPTLVDKYGIINKEIDKPDIVNYDNPELAQAIGPQLLEVYSSLPNVIKVTAKLNLALELGDIVSLRRNMNLITPDYYTDYSKYTELNTYYRACKITGMNYNFSKKQITYTLRDVSNKNNEPQYEFDEYIYDFPVQLGVKE